MSVQVKWRESESVMVVEIDPDKLTWKHLMDFTKLEAKAKAGEISEYEVLQEMTELLSTITGLDILNTPARVVNELLQQLKKLTSPETEEIKN
jgi:hypothetical protein